MISKKTMLLEAYSLLYDIETSLKNLLLKKLNRQQHLYVNDTYANILTHVETYQLLPITLNDYKLLRQTITIRNKVCHMKPLQQSEITLLEKAHRLIQTSNQRKKVFKPYTTFR
ncbi:hypothetical protein [Halalkalibacter lacteus]|uniref:hypothetical protein n=1 Tax=Halalkalibacter lacteus TaxID=3090663 RepID=UPI002FCC0C00